jgi:hypothetical protein
MKVKINHSRKEEIDSKLIEIQVYDKRKKYTENVVVEKLSETTFRVSENAVLHCRLIFGTEFEAKIDKDGEYEFVKVIKKSEFITQRFMLNAKFTESDYRVLGDEIMRQGGYWQVDFGSIATINLPKDSTIDLDEILKTFDFYN